MINLFKSKDKEELKETKPSKIETTITFKNGTKESYRRTSDTYTLLDHDTEFLDWFHIWKKETFVYNYKNGICIYNKNDIRSIDIKFIKGE